MFAAIVYEGAHSSALYRVQPVEAFEVDPDFPATGYQAKRARIIAVDEVDVKLSDIEQRRRMQPYLTWDDGRPRYNTAGRLQLSWQLAERGVTQQQLDATFAPWTAPEAMAAAFGGHLV